MIKTGATVPKSIEQAGSENETWDALWLHPGHSGCLWEASQSVHFPGALWPGAERNPLPSAVELW